LTVASIIVALLILLAMPGVGGYGRISAMRSTGVQFASDVLEGEEIATSQNLLTYLRIGTFGHPGECWAIEQDYPVDQTSLYRGCFPPGGHFTNNCIQVNFSTKGGVSAAQGCTRLADPLEILCIDNNDGANSANVTYWMGMATGEVTAVPGSGVCT